MDEITEKNAANRYCSKEIQVNISSLQQINSKIICGIHLISSNCNSM